MGLQAVRLPKGLHVAVAQLLHPIASFGRRKCPNCILPYFIDKPEYGGTEKVNAIGRCKRALHGFGQACDDGLRSGRH